MDIWTCIEDETQRRQAFPVAEHWAYFGNAGVCPLPRVAVDAMAEFAERGSTGCQENAWSAQLVGDTRKRAAHLLGAQATEIALLGPTSLGLSLVAQGLAWRPGDEVVYYGDDYPANVYPWADLARHGVRPVALKPAHPGVITWELVEAALTERTRLVALATCHFLSGYRIDIEGIAKRLHERGILVCVDGIQTLGAFPIRVEHIDFLSADSHKWLLGPLAAGVFYVKRSRQDELRPALLGSWNVVSPGFVAQDSIAFPGSAMRYEPGALNLPGIAGMEASMALLMEAGVDRISERILALRGHLLEQVRPLGWKHMLEVLDERGELNAGNTSGIVSLYHPEHNADELFERAKASGIFLSLRQDRSGRKYLRFSPHFYNTFDEIDRAVAQLKG